MLEDKTILVTGGTGSLGQAFITEVLKERPRAIRIYSRGETKQVEMQRRFNSPLLRFFIGDIRDRDRLDAIMRGVDIVIHAAALKHVAVGERNPQELVKTNVMGTINVIDIAAKHKVGRVLAISTDKAVYPISAYGASKCLMEHLFKDANLWSAPDTRFSVIRSGNFWSSSGSVIPLWEEQAKTGAITITNPDMIRFWITLPDIAKFAIKCLQIMKGAEIFVPEMQSTSMRELATRLHPTARKDIIGSSGNEKIEESLFAREEYATVYDGYSVITGQL